MCIFSITTKNKMINNEGYPKSTKTVFNHLNSTLNSSQFLIWAKLITPRTLNNLALIKAVFASFNPLNIIKIVLVSFVIAEQNKRLSTKN